MEVSLYIDPDVCIDCSACEAACPVSAIVLEDELSEDDVVYLERARAFFNNE